MAIEAAIFHHSKHLESSELHPQIDNCPFCKSMDRTFLLVLQKNPDVNLLDCNNCAGSSATRIPTDKALADFYGSYYASAEKDAVTFDNSSRFGAHVGSFIAPRVSHEPVSVLDFGGGDGTLGMNVAMSLVENGASSVNVLVIDYETSIVTASDRRIVMQKCAGISSIEHNTRFDVVVASAIIEHLPDPETTLRNLFGLLATGGIFYARTPWVVPLIRVQKFLCLDYDFTYPAHIHDLGKNFWERWVQRFNNNSTRGDELQLLVSQPSIVETTFRRHFLRTLAAHAFKLPWRFARNKYSLVGGWEIFCQKRP